jgi:Zn-dependent peptidase ImmA (M78 family)
MKWVADTTGRFQWRPVYQPEELDTECERIVTAFLLQKYGAVRFPLSTDDLTVMMEQDTSYLDLYADLSGEGEDVEGLTDFFKNKKPAVKISQKLSEDVALSARLRITLAHEYGHVKFHNFLWDIAFRSEQKGDLWKSISRQRRKIEDMRKKSAPSYGINSYPPLKPGESFAPDKKNLVGPRCKAALITDAPVVDWMEWQAAYTGGAFLMPVSALKKFINEYRYSGADEYGLITVAAALFGVSGGAVGARLDKLGYLEKQG